MSKFKTFCESILEEKSSETLVVKLLREDLDNFEKYCDQMIKLRRELSEAEYIHKDPNKNSPPDEELDMDIPEIRNDMKSNIYFYILIESKTDTVIGTGYFFYSMMKPTIPTLSGFVVTKNNRGLGDGKFFINEMIRMEKERNPKITKVALCSHKGRNSDWYQNIGFTIHDEFIPEGYKDTYVHMEKTI